MYLKDLIGQTLTQVTEEEPPDNDVILLHFGNRVIRVAAIDSSEPGTGGCVSLYVEVEEVKKQ